MVFSFALRAVFESQEKAGIVFSALQPELNQKHERGSKAQMNLEGNSVVFSIEALDKKSLKASVNSYLKLFDLSVRSLEVS